MPVKKTPLPICSVDGCENLAREHGRTLCCKHAKRLRVHGDVNYVTPEHERAERQRAALIKNIGEIKAHTYRKFHGRHEHRVVAEKMIGRPLQSDEHVHHIDGNKHNNAPENLVVMSRIDHLRLHAQERRNA